MGWAGTWDIPVGWSGEMYFYYFGLLIDVPYDFYLITYFMYYDTWDNTFFWGTVDFEFEMNDYYLGTYDGFYGNSFFWGYFCWSWWYSSSSITRAYFDDYAVAWAYGFGYYGLAYIYFTDNL